MFIKIFKKIFLLLFSAFLFYQSFHLSSQLLKNSSNLSTVESIIVGILINLYFTGTFAFLGFALPSSRILNLNFYKVNQADRWKNLYKILGVAYFRQFLLATVWKNKRKRKEFFSGGKNGLTNFIFQSHQAEFGHLGSLVLIQILLSILLIKENYLLFLAGSTTNLFFNFYPIVLQRYHRCRIQEIIEKR